MAVVCLGFLLLAILAQEWKAVGFETDGYKVPTKSENSDTTKQRYTTNDHDLAPHVSWGAECGGQQTTLSAILPQD